ncbi:hypothetical protein PSTG_11630 [Puccinia striiformis f. sp. tritici PST-78]|uniref:Uncharacterized protein n=1 Tax=Puccinia striiformis f. sp. tritici PST-78 TaxID=1165861 RepID=A0A0L0V6Y9_9BASI|nr:hypothetical protein PSTG_11630 [Puccinia striiformis f. sp. tritici PST-78]
MSSTTVPFGFSDCSGGGGLFYGSPGPPSDASPRVATPPGNASEASGSQTETLLVLLAKQKEAEGFGNEALGHAHLLFRTLGGHQPAVSLVYVVGLEARHLSVWKRMYSCRRWNALCDRDIHHQWSGDVRILPFRHQFSIGSSFLQDQSLKLLFIFIVFAGTLLEDLQDKPRVASGASEAGPNRGHPGGFVLGAKVISIGVYPTTAEEVHPAQTEDKLEQLLQSLLEVGILTVQVMYKKVHEREITGQVEESPWDSVIIEITLHKRGPKSKTKKKHSHRVKLIKRNELIENIAEI